MSLKVLFTTYSTAFQNPGGGEIVLLKTRQALQENGITVDLFDPWNSKIKNYDIVHDFSLHSWRQWSAFKAYGPKLAVTPVAWPHVKFPYPQKEKIKHFLLKTLKRDHPESSLSEALKLPDIFLPTTELESQRLKNRYAVMKNSRCKIIPNGISLPPINDDAHNSFVEAHKINDYLLYVGRITKIKNIELIIEAAKKTNKDLFIIGDVNKDEQDYLTKLKTISNHHIHFIPSMPHNSKLLLDAYRGAKALIVASFFETCSLVGMEAGALGTPVIMTEEGATKEIYKDYVTYINPHQETSLIQAIEKNWNSKPSDHLKNHVLKNYTWDKIAKNLTSAYEEILK